MQRVLPLALIGLLTVSHPRAGNAHPGGGRVQIYSDATFSQCSLTDTSPAIADVYIVHVTTGSAAEPDASGILLRLSSSAGFSGTWLEDIVPAGMSHSGTSQSGIGIGYGQCPAGSAILALRVRYQMQGTSSPCSFLEAGAAPNLPVIVTTTCFVFFEFPVDGDRIEVNPDESCPCEIPLATQPTTWGRVKAMYRN